MSRFELITVGLIIFSEAAAGIVSVYLGLGRFVVLTVFVAGLAALLCAYAFNAWLASGGRRKPRA